MEDDAVVEMFAGLSAENDATNRKHVFLKDLLLPLQLCWHCVQTEEEKNVARA